MKKIVSLVTFVLLLLPKPVYAAFTLSNGCTLTPAGSTATDVPSLPCLAQIVLNVINFAFGILGVVTLLMLLFGAIKYVTSTGDPKAIQGAQKTMTYAVLGAVAVLSVALGINIITGTLSLNNILTSFTFFQGP